MAKRKTASKRPPANPQGKANGGAAAQFEVPPLDTLQLAATMDRVAKLLSRAVGDVARQHDATPGQLYIVAALSRAPEGLSAKALADALAIRPGSLTGMLDRLEERGVLRRDKVEGDGRQQRLVLLAGAANLIAALPEVDATVQSSLGGTSGDGLTALRELAEQTEDCLRDSPAPRPKKTVRPPVIEPKRAPSEARPAMADNWLPPRTKSRRPSIRRGLGSISSRVLSAVDAQIRKRRDS